DRGLANPVPVPAPRTRFRPTKPLKSLICDGSERPCSGIPAGRTGKWWMKIPNGETPPGIGFGRALLGAAVLASSGVHKFDVKAKAVAPAALSTNFRRERP